MFWVVPEGMLGDIVNALSHGFGGTTDVHWHVVQDAQKPNSNAQGPFPNRGIAQGIANHLNQTTTPLAATANSSDTGPATSGLTGGINDIGNFFHALTEKETWTRVGEVLLGGILLYAGVRALAHGSTVAGSGARQSATRPVKNVAKKAASVAAPEVRLAYRTGAKRVAPKTTARVAAHRAQAKQYGAKTPYSAPKPRAPIVHKVERVSHIHHHAAPKPTTAKPKLAAKPATAKRVTSGGKVSTKYGP